MSLDDWRLIFVSICLLLIFSTSALFVRVYTDKKVEPFFVFAVLGSGKNAELYFPDDNPEIGIREDVGWIIYLHNHMAVTKYVSVRIKLLNSTMKAPNSSLCIPSTEPAIYEVRRILLNNETWFYPISWSIQNINQMDDDVEIRSLSINEVTVESNCVSVNGNNYRLLFELWVYDDDVNEFTFDWGFEDIRYCAWNQIWFNVTAPG